MRKSFCLCSAALFLCLTLLLSLPLTSCVFGGGNDGGEVENVRLTVPTLRLDRETGIASWDPIPGADVYAYTVSGSLEQYTSETSVQLVYGNTLRVSARPDHTKQAFEIRNDGRTIQYLDSDFSEPLHYSFPANTVSKEEDFTLRLDTDFYLNAYASGNSGYASRVLARVNGTYYFSYPARNKTAGKTEQYHVFYIPDPAGSGTYLSYAKFESDTGYTAAARVDEWYVQQEYRTVLGGTHATHRAAYYYEQWQAHLTPQATDPTVYHISVGQAITYLGRAAKQYDFSIDYGDRACLAAAFIVDDETGICLSFTTKEATGDGYRDTDPAGGCQSLVTSDLTWGTGPLPTLPTE